jgi:NAD(P)-dependent dehydrogenase (short-subunit alcohol dehydrogenase family)
MVSETGLRGRRAVVTGAGHGIGEAIASRLADAGAEVIAIDRDGTRLASAFKAGQCQPLVATIGVDDPVGLAESVLTTGPVELIINNVSGWTGRTFLTEDPALFAQSVEVNLRAPLFFTKRLVEALIEAGRPGSVLFISSLHDKFVRLFPAYSIGKAGVAMMIKELAYELAPHRIRVNGISPGWIETAKPGEPAITEQHAINLIPAGRFGEPDEVARLAAVLLDDEISSYVTGVNLPVDGGLSLHNWLMDV